VRQTKNVVLLWVLSTNLADDRLKSLGFDAIAMPYAKQEMRFVAGARVQV
jgi:hypothetical protein